MQKVQYLLWRLAEETPDELSAAVEGLGAELVAAGARGVQLNTMDAAMGPGAGVAPHGRRRVSVPEPWDAVVSLWLDSANTALRAPFEAILSTAGRRIAGYLVVESEPLPIGAEHQVADGVRLDGFVQVAFLRVPDRLDPDEWRRRWQDEHTAVAIETQSTFGYRQNEVVRRLHTDGPELAAIVEEAFPLEALTDWYVFFDAVDESGTRDELRLGTNASRMLGSTTTFLDVEAAFDVLPTSEVTVRDPFR